MKGIGNTKPQLTDEVRSLLQKIAELEARVTVGKQVEGELKESEENYRRLIEISPNAIFVHIGQKIIFMNPAGLEIIGAHNSSEIIGKSILDLTHPDYLEVIKRRQEFLKKGEAPRNEYFKAIRLDGSVIDVEATSDRVTYQGKSAIMSTIRDVTDRLKAQEAYRSLVDHSLQGLAIFQNGRAVFANQAMADITGYTVEEMLTLPSEQVQAFVHPDDRELVWSWHRAWLNGEELPERYEFRGIRKDGSICWVESHTSRIEYQGKPAIQAAYVDITEEKRAREALRESRDYLQKLTNSMWDAVFSVKMPERVIEWANDSFRLIGYEPQECIGKTTEFLYPDDSEFLDFGNKLKGAMAAEKDVLHAEQILKRKNGETFPAEITTTFFREKGEIVRVTSIVRDVSERKKAEQSLQEAEAELKHTIEVVPGIIAKANVHTGYFTHCNPALSSILGFSSEEFLSRPFIEFVHPDDRQSTINEVEQQLKGSPVVRFENRYICKDGSYKWLEWRATEADENGVVYAAATDITERKQAEQFIRTQAEVTKNMAEGAYIVGLHDVIIRWANPRFEGMFGYEPGEMIGRHVSIVNASTDLTPIERADEIMEVIRRTGEWHGEVNNIKKDGTPFWCYASVSTFTHPEYGEALLAVHTDITERKKAEEQIAKLAKFPAENPNPVLRISGRGTVIYCNKACATLVKTWRCCVGESLPDHWHELVMDSLSSGQSQQIEVKCDGRIFSLTFAPVVKANYVNVYGHDITERKKAEEELRLYGEITVNMSEGVYAIRASDGIIVYSNPKFEQMFGYGPGELIGKHVSVINAPTEKSPQETAKEIIDVLNKKGVWRGEILNIKKDGILFWCYASVSTFEHTEHKKVWVTMHTDITERKKAEDKLLEDQAKLKAMASKMLLTEERERQRLAVGLHDEVCQKLVLTKLALESSLNLVSDPKVLASLRIVCEGIGETIEQADSLTFELSNPVLRQLGFVIALEKYLTEEIRQKHGIEYELESDEQLGTLPDEIKNCLFRVTRELLTNVVKHAHARKVKVSARKSQSQIYVRVQDDGVGFKESQAGATVSKTARFGLFSIREQLEYLGGRLEIESEPGRGTKATVVVPLRDKAVV